MNKLSTIISLLFVSLGITLNGQVFISEVFDEIVLVGPDNVEINHCEVAQFYIAELEDLSSELQSKEEQNTSTILTLESEKRLKRKERTILNKTIIQNELIEDEMNALEGLLETWKEYENKNKLLEILTSDKFQDNCYVATTDKGTFYFDELEFITSRTDHEGLNNGSEVIKVEKQEASSAWVKKRAERNCLSADPNDCLVWCLVEKKGGYKFIDIRGNEQIPEECPAGFSISSNEISCIRESKFEFSDTSFDLTVKLKDSNESIKITSWFVGECK